VTGSARDEGAWWDLSVTTPGATVDFTADANRHVMVWVKFDSISFLDTLENGGIFIIAGSSTANWSKWYMLGSDVYSGGWVRLILDMAKKPSENAGTPASMNAIQFLGVGVKMNGTVTGADNFFIDRLDYGQPELQAYADAVGNVDVDWQAYFDEDDAIGNKYGIIQKRPGNDPFFLLGGITAGLSTQSGTTTFLDASDAVVEFTNPTYHNGDAVVSAIDSSLIYKISAEGAASQNTAFTLGEVVGAADARQGVNGGVIQTAGPRFTMDFETDIADLSAVNIYGTKIKDAGVCQFSGSAETDVIGSTFAGCDEVQPNDAEFLNNFIIAPSPDRGLEMAVTNGIKRVKFVAGETADQRFVRVWQIDVSPTPDGFVEFTAEAAEATADDVICFPATEADGDLFVLGAPFKFAKARINTGTARSGGALLLRYWNGSAWATISGATDGTNTLSTTGLQDITFTPPTDWAAVSLDGENPAFYIGFEVDTGGAMTTNPLVTEAWVADQVEHHVHLPVHETYSFTTLEFFGFGAAGAPKWHGENSETRQVITAGSFVVTRTYEIVTAGSTDFTLIGSADNNVGTRFTATGVGSGTGTAAEVSQIDASAGADPVEGEFDNTGATAGEVRVTNNIQVTFTGVKDDTEIRVYDSSSGAELAGIENATAGDPDERTFAATLQASTVVDYTLINVADWEIIRVNDFTWPTSDGTLPQEQRQERNYNDP